MQFLCLFSSLVTLLERIIKTPNRSFRAALSAYFYFKFKEAENAPLCVTSSLSFGAHASVMQSALISQVRRQKHRKLEEKSNTTTAAAVIKQRFFTASKIISSRLLFARSLLLEQKIK
jgi:hypothetical protein